MESGIESQTLAKKCQNLLKDNFSEMNLIIIAGMPATGKSFLADRLQQEFGYPILEKDNIKEQLFDTLGFKCYDEKRKLDVASNAVLLSIMQSMMKAGISLIVDNNFPMDLGAKIDTLLSGFDVNYVTIFMDGDPEILYKRYYNRDKLGARHLGHAMQQQYPPSEVEPEVFNMSRDDFDERFLKLGMDKMSWGGKVIHIDATYPNKLDVSAITKEVRKELN